MIISNGYDFLPQNLLLFAYLDSIIILFWDSTLTMFYFYGECGHLCDMNDC